jgi:hypothetical protein
MRGIGVLETPSEHEPIIRNIGQKISIVVGK